MGMLDGMLGQLAGNLDVAGLAAKVGLTPEQVQMAVVALGRAHPAPGDTVDTASQQTGLPTGPLQQIVAHLGGEAGLAQIAGMLGQQGGMLGQIGGLASGFFNKQ